MQNNAGNNDMKILSEQDLWSLIIIYLNEEHSLLTIHIVVRE